MSEQPLNENQNVPKVASRRPIATPLSADHYSAVADRQPNASSEHHRADQFSNPLRQSVAAHEFETQQFPGRQVAYAQDQLDWRQRENNARAMQQQSYGPIRLEGPIQDDVNSAPRYHAEAVQPIHDPFDDNGHYGSSSRNFEQIAPPRRQGSYGQPTPADPRTNPERHSIQNNHQESFFDAPAQTSDQGYAPSHGSSRVESLDGSRHPRMQSSNYRQEVFGQDDQGFGFNDELNGKKGERSCDTYREELLDRPITDIVVDISPFRPQQGQIDYQAVKMRDWRDRCGRRLATGTLLRIERSYAIISNQSGQEESIHLASLGDSDLAEVSGFWGVPVECTLGCFEYQGRCWTPLTTTWYASNLCHKPLYFEDVQLERYGHSAGPFRQPIRSAGHFFVSLAFLPYHKRINPSNECIYALGYYRPGNCAPWLVDPVPISLEGGINMAIDYATIGLIIP